MSSHNIHSEYPQSCRIELDWKTETHRLIVGALPVDVRCLVLGLLLPDVPVEKDRKSHNNSVSRKTTNISGFIIICVHSWKN